MDADVLSSMKRTVSREVKETKAAEKKPQSAESTTTAEKADKTAGSEETDDATASSEGGEEGTDNKAEKAGGDAGLGIEGSDESGSDDSDTQDTTATEEDSEASTEEEASEEDDEEEADDEEPAADTSKKKWEKEDQDALTAWLGKEAAKLPLTDATRKLVKIARDNNAAALESKQTVSVLNDHIAQLGEAIVNHDVEALQSIAEELGGEKLPFDTRTYDDKAKEIADGYNETYDALEAALKGKPDIWAAVQDSLAAIEKKTMSKIGKYKEDALLERARNAGREASGKPAKGTINKSLETKANQNFTDLKSKDAKAQDRFEALKPFFAGGLLRDKNRIYALNPKLADKLGEAVEFHANFAKVHLPKIREALKAELKAQKLLKAPPSGRKEAETSGGGPAKGKSTAKNFNHHAGRKIMDRWAR